MFNLHCSLTLAFAFLFASVVCDNKFDSFISELGSSNTGYENKINIDKIIDKNINEIRKILSEYDPVDLDEIPLLGKGYLTDGHLDGLSSMYRTENCTLAYSKKVMTFELNLGWDTFTMDFDYSFKLWFIQRYGKLTGNVEMISIKLLLQVDMDNYEVILQEFKFNTIGKVTIKLEGNFGDSFRTWIGNIILNLFKDPIASNIEKTVSDVFRDKIDELNTHIPKNKQFKYVDLVRLNDSLDFPEFHETKILDS